jgi:Cyclic nucleotide-binding domain
MSRVQTERDLSSRVQRSSNRVTEKGMLTKLLIQLGIEPSNVTFDAIFSRLVDIAFANINIANMLALCGAVLYVITLLMRTIVPLRIFGIVGDMFFIGYGVLANSVTTFFLYLLLLPINSIRLYQMLKLVKRARLSAQGDLSMSWLEPYMSRRKYRAGNVLFRKGEVANEMFIAVTGKFHVPELGKALAPGTVFGELGFLSKNNRRTQSVECTEAGEVLTITYDKLLELYFQNPEFGYYFLRLTSDRLLQNMAQLEEIIEQNRDVIEQNKAKLDPGPSIP